MKVTIRDAEALRRVLPAAIGSYFRSHGWTEVQAHLSDNFALWNAPGQAGQLMQPLSRDLDDYPSRMYDVVAAISDLEKRSQLEVLKLLQSVDFDVVGVGEIAGADQDNNVPIKVSRDLISSLYDLAVSAAYASIEKRPVIPRRRPNRVLEYMASLKFSQLQNGSLRYALLSPVFTSIVVNQPTLFPLEVEEQRVIPFERVVLKMLISSVRAARNAAQRYERTGNIGQFSDAVDEGVTSTLCDGLVEMSEALSTKEPAFDVMWSPKLPDDMQAKVTVPASQISALREASWFLKEQGDREEFLLIGPVVLLGRDVAETEGRIQIAAAIDERPQRVLVKLAEPEYHDAVGAHDERKTVAVKGTLHKDGRSWHLLQPEGFRVVEG